MRGSMARKAPRLQIGSSIFRSRLGYFVIGMKGFFSFFFDLGFVDGYLCFLLPVVSEVAFRFGTVFVNAPSGSRNRMTV